MDSVVDSPTQGKTLAGVLALVILLVGFGDGLAFGLQRQWALASPWVVLFPLLGLALLLYLATPGRPPHGRDAIQAAALVWLFAIGLVIQVVLLQGKMNVAGYLQLAAFVVALTVIRSTFARGHSRLPVLIGPAVLVAHAFMCSYLAIAWVVWQVTGIDLSVIALTAGRDIGAYYGYRPAGWSLEPAWASMAVSVSFIGVYYLAPRARIFAMVAMVIAALALQAATLLLFVALVGVIVVARRQPRLLLVAAPVIVAVLVLPGPFTPRIEAIATGTDPSTQMRIASAGVATDVIVGSFPIGVGYGNFRDVAIYGSEWSRYLDLTVATFYKSDLLILNYVAELGAAGLLVVALVFTVLGFGRLLLPTVFLGMQALLSGTILVPALLVLAAVVGAIDRRTATEVNPGSPEVPPRRFGPRAGRIPNPLPR